MKLFDTVSFMRVPPKRAHNQVVLVRSYMKFILLRESGKTVLLSSR